MNPLKTQLHIFQLEGYEPLRLLRWWIDHPFTFQATQKKPLVYTFKVKLILAVVAILILFLTISIKFPYNLFTVTFFAFEPFPLLILSLYLIKPYEIIRRILTIESTRRQVLTHPHLITIGITGSYGKTSTKDFLYSLLTHPHQTLKTPESYNTIFGISKVVALELHKKLNYFICEMGAYKRGEIKELTHMVPPQFAILTAIGSQHLERFKSLKNTTLAKFELVDAVKPQNAVVCLDNQYIQKHLSLPRYQKVKTYSISNPRADYYLSNIKINDKLTSFTLHHDRKQYSFTTHLFGTSNLMNLTGAIAMTLMLKIDPKNIAQAVLNIKSSPHRLELKSLGKCTLIDNAFSSNAEGFARIISDLKNMPGKKALITPGIIELGQDTHSIHKGLGEQASDVFDSIIFIGENHRTKAFAQGVNTENKVSFLPGHSSVWPTINELAKSYDWILLENDLPDNF